MPNFDRLGTAVSVVFILENGRGKTAIQRTFSLVWKMPTDKNIV
jgi:hypothetical protein